MGNKANVYWQSILNQLVSKKTCILKSRAESLQNRRVFIAKYCTSGARVLSATYRHELAVLFLAPLHCWPLKTDH